MEKHKRINLKKRAKKETILKDEIENFIEKLKAVQDNEFKFWKQSVSEDIAKVTVPLYIKNHIFYVKVPDDVRRFELTRNKTEIITKINSNLQLNKIQDIVFI